MIPYGRQSIDESDIAAVILALQSDYLTTGPLVEKFEEELEKVVGAPCISVTSGTAALHCAYAAIGLELGDEVITPPITFIATQATAALFGAKIVFADVQPDTANIDPKAVEAAITPRTKAIVAVDFAGHPADLDELRVIADKHKVFLIEDAAHAIGSTYKNRPIGSIADITTFSFFPTKNMTTGEGGALASIHPELLEKAKRFSRQGLVRNKAEFLVTDQGPWHQEVHEFGLNYRLPDVLCALGLSQLSRLQDFKDIRKVINSQYRKTLRDIPSLNFLKQHEQVDPMWHLVPIQIAAKYRAKLFSNLTQSGFKVQVNYFPAHLHPVFLNLGFSKGMFPVAEKFYSQEVSLPIYTDPQVFNQNYFESIHKVIRDSIND